MNNILQYCSNLEPLDLLMSLRDITWGLLQHKHLKSVYSQLPVAHIDIRLYQNQIQFLTIKAFWYLTHLQSQPTLLPLRDDFLSETGRSIRIDWIVKSWYYQNVEEQKVKFDFMMTFFVNSDLCDLQQYYICKFTSH